MPPTQWIPASLKPLQSRLAAGKWHSHIHFLNVHWAYIVTISLLAFVLLTIGQDLSSIDAFFFAVSSATGTGLNTTDLNKLNTYTQAVLYTIPFLTNSNVINTAMVAVRWHFFGQELNQAAVDRMATWTFQSTQIDHVEQPEGICKPATRPPRLSSKERKRLGGPEYAALGLLLKILVAHFVVLHFLGILFLLPWIMSTSGPYPEYLSEQGIRRSWWSIQSAATMVNNLGLTLTPDSMFTLRNSPWPMIAMSTLALMGNTFFPVFLRFWIWALTKVVSSDCSLQEPLAYLLKHPRRCFTFLFPRRPTWILCLILVSLNLFDMFLIIAFDVDRAGVGLDTLPPRQRLGAILFQAASIRTSGTTSLSVAAMHPAVQFILVVMMYVGPLPVAIGTRYTVDLQYEERDMCVFDEGEDDKADAPGGHSGFGIKRHLQNQLSFDLWFMIAGMFMIACAEQKPISDSDDPAFSMFAIIFETVSAYGNVGLSLGHPGVNSALSGQFKTFSKLVICVLMIRGRHRMLPNKIDRTIQLPRERKGSQATLVDEVEEGVLPEVKETVRVEADR